MGTKRISERLGFSGGTVRRDGPCPVIEGVLLCGLQSRNSRTYLAEAWAGDRVKRYEGRASFVNHANGTRDRDVQDKLAVIENPRHDRHGRPIADYAVNPKHPLAESVLWAAEHKPGFYGLSHVAECRIRYEGGKEVVEEVLAVESVDLVSTPATTKGLYESHRRGVAEMDDMVGDTAMPPMDPPPAEPAAGTDADTALDTAFADGMKALVDAYIAGDLPDDELVSKVRVLCKAHCKATDATTKKPAADKPEKKDDGDGDEKPEKDKPEESMKRLDSWAVLQECRDAGWHTPSPAQLKALSYLPDAADRQAFISESKTAGVGEKPQSTGRKAESVKAAEAKADALPKTADDWAKWITEAA